MSSYDEALEAVVQAFQARHGIDPDGVIGNATIAALNVPVEDRIRQIVLAMERWRWMPDNLGADHVIVNIAGYELKLVKGGKEADRMAVVVGKPYSRTPVFSDAIRYVELNPYWNVPAGIAIKEELPVLRKNPAARAASGLRSRAERCAGAADRDQLEPVRTRQFPLPAPPEARSQECARPGQVRFPQQVQRLPPRYAVARLLRQDRPRLQPWLRPPVAAVDLAEEVLADVPGWDRARIDEVIAGGKNTVVNLVHPLPIHITYLTAWVQNGQVNFRSDVYEQDEKLIDALAGRSMAW